MPQWNAVSDDSSSETSSTSTAEETSPHPLTSSHRGVKKKAGAARGSAAATKAFSAHQSKYVQSFLSPSDDEANPPMLSRASAHSPNVERRHPASRETTPSPAPHESAPASGSEKHTIHMDFDDEYVGEAIAVAPPPPTTSHHGHRSSLAAEQLLFVPHGNGTLQSTSGKHCYVGGFVHRERDGDGKLLTDKTVLWCKWTANRPDFAASARLDTTSGDKYHGYLVARTDMDIVQRLTKSASVPMSKFSVWVNATKFTKERWGELVGANSVRFFGQWVNDVRNGFGCMLLPSGDRYVGMFQDDMYHGAGVLFSKSSSTTSGSEGSPSKGGSSRSLFAALHSSFASGCSSAAGRPRWSPVVESILSPAGATASQYAVVYDGVWSRGTFESLDAQVTFPCGTRVRGSWRSLTSVAEGGVNCPRKPRMFEDSGEADFTKRWTETFQWESLLCGSSESSKHRSHYGARSIRSRLLKARDRTGAVAQLSRFLKEDTLVLNAIKVFRRCFYFFYGTCGSSSEIGGGLAGNTLGWCSFRGASGGCIHRGRGRPIQPSDIDAALGDIFSMVSSIQRWTVEILGDTAVDHARELEAEGVIVRLALDAALAEVYPVLLNLYVQAYKVQEENLRCAVSRLRGTTLDDLGVVFGRHESDKLFDPYADASRSLGELSRCRCLTDMIRTLVMWSKEIDTSTKLAQVSLHDEHLCKISSVIRERRQSVVGHRSPPPATAQAQGPQSTRSIPDGDMSVPSINDGSGPLSPPPSPVSVQWNNSFASPSSHSQAADESPSLAPQGSSFDTHASRRRQSKFMDVAAEQLEAGSADDLIPIHQYVLLRGAPNVENLYAITKLLVDLSADDAVVDPTSRDCFCITTLHACVTTLMQLDPDLRERTLIQSTAQSASILTPATVFERRIEETAQLLNMSTRPALADALAMWLPRLVESLVDGTVVDAHSDGGGTSIEQTIRGSWGGSVELDEIAVVCDETLRSDSGCTMEDLLGAAKRLCAAAGIEIQWTTDANSAQGTLESVVARLELSGLGRQERHKLHKYLTPVATSIMSSLLT